MARCKTRKAKYGLQKLFAYRYRDTSDRYNEHTKRTWAYDKEDLREKFWSGPDADGWEILESSIKCVKE